MRGLPILLYLMWRSASFAVASKCNTFSSTSGHGKYLTNHVLQSIPNTSLQDCTNQCVKAGFCRSTNFHSQSKTCELNNADKHDYPDDYIERQGFTYSGWQTKHFLPKSCSEVKKKSKVARSGYYLIQTKRRRRLAVYCDMDKDDGGWTLVVSVSSANWDHLQRAENNCFNSSLCVEYKTTAIAGRKLSDHDIVDIILEDGVFRIDVLSGSSSPFTVFYKIPSGAQDFDSSCTGQGPPVCPRIIISHHYPYQWESNTCNNINVGYRIRKVPHYVFDSWDDSECGAPWYSSGHPARRVLYGYQIDDHYGIHSQRQALVFVK